jgi:hypothetical protein
MPLTYDPADHPTFESSQLEDSGICSQIGRACKNISPRTPSIKTLSQLMVGFRCPLSQGSLARACHVLYCPRCRSAWLRSGRDLRFFFWGGSRPPSFPDRGGPCRRHTPAMADPGGTGGGSLPCRGCGTPRNKIKFFLSRTAATFLQIIKHTFHHGESVASMHSCILCFRVLVTI